MEPCPPPRIVHLEKLDNEPRLTALPGFVRQRFWPVHTKERDMHQIIYLVGLIVVILAILSFFGLR
jgi:hypothetical protein